MGLSISVRTQLTLMLLVGLTLASLSASSTSQAHPAGDFYKAKWGSNRLTDGVKWRFTQGFPGGNYRDRMKDAAARWNNLNQSMKFNFEQNQSDYSDFSFSSCPTSGGPDGNGTEKDAMHWGPIDGVAIGQANLCTFYESGGTDANSYKSFQIKMDSNVTDWYVGTNDSFSGTDLLGPAAHEFGHATGREVGGYDGDGHFDPNGTYCPLTESGHHTMCASVIVNRSWDRSLNTHDKDAFQNAY